MFVFLAILCVLLLILYTLNQFRRPNNYPPGPQWLPVVGNVPELKKMARSLGGMYLALSKMAEQFNTAVLGLRLGRDYVVVISTYPVVRYVLTNEEFDARPDNFFIKLRSFGTRKGITCTDGPFWKEQRSFVTRHMRNLGYGKKSMETQIKTEVEDILEIIDNRNLKEPDINLEPIFAISVINVIWSLVTGSRIPRDDERLSSFLNLLHERSKAFDMSGGTLSQFPWLRHFFPEQTGYNLLLKINVKLQEFFKNTIEEHYNSWYPGRQDDLIYTYITQMKEVEGKETTFTYDQLVMVCLDLFIAGANTTSNTLDFIFLMMLLHPEIQEKAVNELKSTSLDEPLTYAERLKYPYIEAIIMEIERFYTIAPIAGPRRVTKETTINGYTIPKGTTILVNLDSVHRDKEIWGDPQVFRPERFLDANGELLSGDRVVIFGLGRRRCLGELLARQCIFLFFTEIIRRYEICPVPGIELPSSKPMPGISLSPQKYNVHIIPRSINKN